MPQVRRYAWRMLPPCVWSMPLQRIFTSFPSGAVGATLLVLRSIIGASAILEAALAIAENHSAPSVLVACADAVAGLTLILGFLTPIASMLLAAGGAAILLGLHSVALRLLDSQMALFEFVVIAAALGILGPGATSIDARLFGRREVTISEAHPRDL